MNNSVAFLWLILFLSGWCLSTIFLYAALTSSLVAPRETPRCAWRHTSAKSGGRTSTCSTSTSVLSFCLFTRTRLSPPTSNTWAFPSSTSSIIPLHPSKSPCFIPTNCTPWPISRSPTVSCDHAPAVVSLAAPPAFAGCFSLSHSLPSDAPLVSVVFSLL